MAEHPDKDDPAATEAAYYPGRLTSVASFGHPAEARIALQKLESEGIDAYLDNENLVATDWLLANATAGIKLMVRGPDVPAAEAVLRAKGTPELAIDASDAAANEGDDYLDEEWRCSKCHRIDVELVPLPLPLILLTLPLLCAPLLLLSRTCRCKSCGHEWRQ